MSYQETVQKILSQGSHRAKERQELWQKVAQAYRDGDPDAVAKKLAAITESSSEEFEEALKELEDKL